MQEVKEWVTQLDRDGRAIGEVELKSFLRRGKKSHARVSGSMVSSDSSLGVSSSNESPYKNISDTGDYMYTSIVVYVFVVINLYC